MGTGRTYLLWRRGRDGPWGDGYPTLDSIAIKTLGRQKQQLLATYPNMARHVTFLKPQYAQPLCPLSAGGDDPHCMSTGWCRAWLTMRRGPATRSGPSGRWVRPLPPQTSPSPPTGHAMRRKLHQPRPIDPCPLRAARLVDAADVRCAASSLFPPPHSPTALVGEMLCQSLISHLLSILTMCFPSSLHRFPPRHIHVAAFPPSARRPPG